VIYTAPKSQKRIMHKASYMDPEWVMWANTVCTDVWETWPWQWLISWSLQFLLRPR